MLRSPKEYCNFTCFHFLSSSQSVSQQIDISHDECPFVLETMPFVSAVHETTCYVSYCDVRGEAAMSI